MILVVLPMLAKAQVNINIVMPPEQVMVQSIGPKDGLYPWSYRSEVGLNMTNLATRFIPLNFNNTTLQDIAIKYRKYRRKLGFKFDFGANIDSENNGSDDQFVYLAFGIEKRKMIYKNKWSYTSSYEIVTSASPNFAFAGIQKGYGLEYSINEKMLLSTQTAIGFGVNTNTEGGVFRANAPTSIFLIARF